jgi:hypothetical protein
MIAKDQPNLDAMQLQIHQTRLNLLCPNCICVEGFLCLPPSAYHYSSRYNA